MLIEGEKKKQYVGADRLSNLPEALVIHILSFLDTKHAVQASLTLKKWVNLWTLIPDLNFDISVFKKYSSFDKFVVKVLTLRDDSVKVNKFSFRRRRKTKIELLERVTEYAVSHDAQHLSIIAFCVRGYVLKDQLGSSNSLRSLKLQDYSLHKSQRLENLVTLHLEAVNLIGPGKFSGYPNLRNLTLKRCHVDSDDLSGSLSCSIVAPQLLRLTILGCFRSHKLVLSTPKLTFFKMEEVGLPSFQIDELKFLDTLDMDFFISDRRTCDERRELVSQLMSMLICFYNVNSLRLSGSLCELLSMFPDILAREPSPFRRLKSLCIVPSEWRKKASVTIPGHVTTYLFGKCLDPSTVIEIELPR